VNAGLHHFHSPNIFSSSDLDGANVDGVVWAGMGRIREVEGVFLFRQELGRKMNLCSPRQSKKKKKAAAAEEGELRRKQTGDTTALACPSVPKRDVSIAPITRHDTDRDHFSNSDKDNERASRTWP
jgi:hypothetical protein